MPQRILILGVNGFIGPALARAAVAAGHEVVGLSRSPTAHQRLPVTYVVADRNDPQTIAQLAEQHQVDVLVDVIAMTLGSTAPLLAELDGKVNQYVLLSSCDVYRNYELLQRTIDGTPDPSPLVETSPLRTTRFPYRGETPRAADAADVILDEYDKIPIEEQVSQLKSNWTVLRLPMVYGPGDKQRRFRWAVEPMSGDQTELLLPQAWADWRTTYGYIDNVAAAICATCSEPATFNQIFNLAEAEPVNQLEWAKRIAGQMNWSGSIERVDDPELPLARATQGINLTVPFAISGKHFREDLGFVDPVSLEQGLMQTIDDERHRVSEAG